MNEKESTNFWMGFVLAAAFVILLYWLKRQGRELSPQPLVVPLRKEPPAPETVTAAVTPDDLEAIQGIGPVFAKKLKQAGIDTFAQLASMKPDEIRAITRVTRWDPAIWIDEASSLRNRK